MNLSEGESGDFLLTLPYKTKIKFVLFPSPQYPPSCNLALIDQEPREVSEKIKVIFILCFCDRIIKTPLLILQGRLFFIIVFKCKDGVVVATVSCGASFI